MGIPVLIDWTMGIALFDGPLSIGLTRPTATWSITMDYG